MSSLLLGLCLLAFQDTAPPQEPEPPEFVSEVPS